MPSKNNSQKNKATASPLSYFYDMLDAASVNTFALYAYNGGIEDLNQYLKSLAYSLVEEEMN